MKSKRTRQMKKIHRTLETQRDVINDTHQKIEMGDEQLYNLIEKQQQTIEALIAILIKNDIIKSETEIQDTIDAKRVIERITETEPTDEEIERLLRNEANTLYILLYRDKGGK